jgi:uncharacterized protein (DUF1330 family)
MKTRYTVALSMIVGAALGGAAIQGLHAQAKLKAYSIAEVEVTDASAQPGYLPCHPQSNRTSPRSHIAHLERTGSTGPPPKNVAIIEWDSFDDAVAFYKSKAWTDLAPQRGCLTEAG